MKALSKKSGWSSILIGAGLVVSLSACDVNLSVDDKTLESLGDIKTGAISLIDDKMTVNGTAYDTSSAVVVADGVETDSSILGEGMVVSVESTESSDGAAVATQIIYNDEVEGIVSSIDVVPSDTQAGVYSGVINVLGQSVTVDANTVFESDDVNDLSIADIDTGNVVEVSGYSSGDGNILATRIEVKSAQYTPGEEIELKGRVANLTDTTFNIGGLTISVEKLAVDSNVLSTLRNGQRVEVSSYEGYDSEGNLIANKIELKNKREDNDSRDSQSDSEDRDDDDDEDRDDEDGDDESDDDDDENDDDDD